ncbi:hypothetical protein ABG768_022502 [Culter alburnus]|uniref:Uncharacterized protein n=1 Tax=Culter alburnus TaxID=194366 RepID=A0AAW2AL12_CULAL
MEERGDRRNTVPTVGARTRKGRLGGGGVGIHIPSQGQTAIGFFSGVGGKETCEKTYNAEKEKQRTWSGGGAMCAQQCRREWKSPWVQTQKREGETSCAIISRGGQLGLCERCSWIGSRGRSLGRSLCCRVAGALRKSFPPFATFCRLHFPKPPP